MLRSQATSTINKSKKANVSLIGNSTIGIFLIEKKNAGTIANGKNSDRELSILEKSFWQLTAWNSSTHDGEGTKLVV